MRRSQEKILFVLVVCGCRVEDSASFQTLLGNAPDEIRHLFVYDNSTTWQSSSLPVAGYVHDTANNGLGKAYNTACDFAASHGYQWLLLLDQDTTFPEGALEAYRKGLDEAGSSIELLAPRHQVVNGKYMSPTHYRMKVSHLQDTAPVGLVKFSDASPINSGILVSVSSFLKVGGYDEKVWLDFSDICFIERYRRSYSSYYVLPDVVCQQNFSAMDTDPDKVYKRYRIYLECAHNYPRRTLLDSLALLVTTLRPTLSRTLRERTFKYLKAYWSIYL